MSIPKRLRREPLIEVIWHVLFEPRSPESAAGDVLVGILYAALRDRESEGTYQVLRLPPADIPHFITEQDPNLRHAVKYRLESAERPVLFQVGDRIVSVNCRRPYVGWASFRNAILFLLETLRANELIQPLRHGLRYLDLFESSETQGLEGLRLELQLGDRTISAEPLQLRVELERYDHHHAIRVIRPAEVKLPREGDKQGTLIDLETWRSALEWEEITKEAIDQLHDAAKRMFFEQILTPALIAKLEPEY